ncbi:hypothetical protein NPIL_26791 [Nephila pilipes]|uniref:Uncharacterized protein n=1 Tax=Nephila pilipes TaxID=299642 RepID=A0A8X6UTQ4_NEPPI|nr:hypothetical protein NPIL_26791 [Nephila pilipes]
MRKKERGKGTVSAVYRNVRNEPRGVQKPLFFPNPGLRPHRRTCDKNHFKKSERDREKKGLEFFNPVFLPFQSSNKNNSQRNNSFTPPQD